MDDTREETQNKRNEFTLADPSDPVFEEHTIQLLRDTIQLLREEADLAAAREEIAALKAELAKRAADPGGEWIWIVRDANGLIVRAYRDKEQAEAFSSDPGLQQSLMCDGISPRVKVSPLRLEPLDDPEGGEIRDALKSPESGDS